MKRTINLWQLMGFAVTSFLGTILHFLYEWLGEATWISPFSGVNDSTREHMKLLFWPMLLFAVVQNAFFCDQEGFWCIKLRGILLGLILIPVIFYTYNGSIGKSPDWLNIAIFFVTAAIAYLYETQLFKREKLHCGSKKGAILALCVIALLFFLFTFFPPTLGIFLDPLTGGYGI